MVFDRDRAEQAVEDDDLDYFRALPSSELQLIIDDSDNWILARACSVGRTPIVDFLLRHGADPNRRDPGESTMLTCATNYDRVTCVASLLAHDADPFARNHMDRNALHQAAAYDAHGSLRLLLPRFTGHLEEPSHNGYTALMLAVVYGRGDPTSAAMLIDAGASLHTVDNVGYALVHQVLLDEQPKADLLALLLARGAPAPDPLPDGRTLAEVARTKRIRKLLRKAGLLGA